MLEVGTIFTTVSLMMLANGLVLAVVIHDLPLSLRSSAKYWQLGTLSIAAGCTMFAYGSGLPRPLMLVSANGFLVFGLAAYAASVQDFCGIRPRLSLVVPCLFAMAGVLWFSTVTENFKIRVFIVSIAWIGLMLVSTLTLLKSSGPNAPRSRKILTVIFAVVLVFNIGRVVLYLTLDFSSNFYVESGSNWLNLLSPIFMTLLPIIGTTAFLLMCSDNLRQQLETAASTDYLTGLPNRRTLALHGGKSFAKASDNGPGFSVAVFDIDNFKAINDNFGHDAGDQVLANVAKHLQAQASNNDVVARTGGEEFAVILSAADHAEAVEATERMRSAVELSDFSIALIKVPVTVSAGVAVYSIGDRTFDDVLYHADQALYAAKTSGRNRVEIARQSAVQTLSTPANDYKVYSAPAGVG